MRFLHLIPRLDHNGASRQLELLARAMVHEGNQIEVCQFGPPSAVSERLRQAGIAAHSLPSNRWIDPASLFQLHGLLRRFQPDLIHAWHRNILRTLALVGRKYLGRVVVSRPFVWDHAGRLSALDRWLLNRAARVVVQGDSEAHLGKEQGLFLEKMALIPPGIEEDRQPWRAEPREGPDSSHTIRPLTGLGSPAARKIVCVGPLERHKGFRDAVWAFDILRYIFPDLQLVFVGEGPDRPELERMAENLECGQATQFIGRQFGVSECLALADVCWIPSQTGGGTQTTLEAMLLGRPVVACRVPSLHGLIVDGDSGFCIPPGDKVSLARRTRQILLDGGLAERLGAQARQRVLDQFSARQFIKRFQRTYAEVA